MTLKNTLKAGAAAAALFAIAAPIATTAEAGIKNGQSKMDLTLYGQVNRAVVFFDDGELTDAVQVDNEASDTRFGMKATGNLSEAVSVGALIEFGADSEGSLDGASQDSNENGFQFGERHMNWWITHKQFGTLKLGQQSETNDGPDQVDLSTSALAGAGMTPSLNTQDILFRNSTTNGLTGTSVGTLFDSFDGGRDDAVSYKTPTINGFNAEAQWGASGQTGVEAYYNGSFSGNKVRLVAAYTNQSGEGTAEDMFQVGGSFKHTSGVSATVYYASEDQQLGAGNSRDEDYLMARLGYSMKNSMGPFGVSVDYVTTEDQGAAGNDGDAWGLNVLQKFDKAALELYGNVRVWDADLAAGTNTDELVTVVVGGRVKF